MKHPRRLYWLLPVLCAAVLLLAVALDLSCPIRALTGIPCPGCGMSRAWLAALRLDLTAAFALHPMFWSVPVVLLYAARGGKLTGRKRLDNICLLALGAGSLICYILRLTVCFGG